MTVGGRARPRQRWFAHVLERDEPASRLFCFAHAGGAASWFRSWSASIPPDVELWPVELPGRSTRLGESLVDDLDELAAQAAAAIACNLDRPSALFGHSMGAALAFEVMHRLRDAGARLPALLIASGLDAPDRLPRRDWHTLPRESLMDRLRELEGTPADVLEHAELLSILLPVIKNDFRALERYRMPTDRTALLQPVAVFGGADDRSTTADGLQAWQRLTATTMAVEMLPGGHFFPATHAADFFPRLRHTLLRHGLTRCTDPEATKPAH